MGAEADFVPAESGTKGAVTGRGNVASSRVASRGAHGERRKASKSAGWGHFAQA